jgi:hypothetical protein
MEFIDSGLLHQLSYSSQGTKHIPDKGTIEFSPLSNLSYKLRLSKYETVERFDAGSAWHERYLAQVGHWWGSQCKDAYLE